MNDADPNQFTCRELKVRWQFYSTAKHKLNLACGRRTIPDCRNVDMIDGPGVDQVVDLVKIPWPWDDNSYDYILVSHWLEHIGHGHFFGAIDELLRIADHGGIIEVKVPHYTDPKALLSPGHCRLIHSYTLRPWTRKRGFSNEHQERKANNIDVEVIDEGHIGHFRLGDITDYHWRKYLKIEPPKVLCHSLDYFMILRVHKR